MRYTTVIDISQIPIVYRNINARILYYHLAMIAGYHDIDRDLVDISIRRLALGAGLTVSATRHALGVLTRAGLLSKQGQIYIVKKWVEEQTVTTRPKTARQQQQLSQAAAARAERERQAKELEIESIRRQQLQASGKSSLQLWREDLERRAAAGDLDAQDTLKRRFNVS